jgi:hypothetical protein
MKSEILQVDAEIKKYKLFFQSLQTSDLDTLTGKWKDLCASAMTHICTNYDTNTAQLAQQLNINLEILNNLIENEHV